MAEIHHSILVTHPAQRMYALVRDVNAYPEFLNWCSGAQVLSDDGALQVASIQVNIKGVRQRFTTENTLTPNRRIDMRLREGPFRYLHGEWHFKALSADGCKVELQMRFDFSSKLLALAFQRGFTQVADHLVEDFRRRADALYGKH